MIEGSAPETTDISLASVDVKKRKQVSAAGRGFLARKHKKDHSKAITVLGAHLFPERDFEFKWVDNKQIDGAFYTGQTVGEKREGLGTQ